MHFIVMYKPGSTIDIEGNEISNDILAKKILKALHNGNSVMFPDTFTVFQRVNKDSKFEPIDPTKYSKKNNDR